MDHDDMTPPWTWGPEEIAARRRELREMAAVAAPDQLEAIAQAGEMLDWLERVRAGEMVPSEALERMEAARKRSHPRDRLTWRAADPRHWGREWSIHPADITNEKIGNLGPLDAHTASLMVAMCQQLWVHTTGDPDDRTEHKNAVILGATEHGTVFWGMSSEVPVDDDDDDEACIANLGVSIPIDTARRLRADLSRAISRAEKLRNEHIAKCRERLFHHLTEHVGVPDGMAVEVADAATEAAVSGLPQMIVTPDGPVTIELNPDGSLECSPDDAFGATGSDDE